MSDQTLLGESARECQHLKYASLCSPILERDSLLCQLIHLKLRQRDQRKKMSILHYIFCLSLLRQFGIYELHLTPLLYLSVRWMHMNLNKRELRKGLVLFSLNINPPRPVDRLETICGPYVMVVKTLTWYICKVMVIAGRCKRILLRESCPSRRAPLFKVNHATGTVIIA